MKFKAALKKLILIGFFTTNPTAFAHEGHSIPGALPPAPHGGNVEEASHLDAELHGDSKDEHQGQDENEHAHEKQDHVNEFELFIEVLYAHKRLSIFPLAILPSDPKSFVSLSPQKDLKDVVIKIEIPRTKTITEVKPNIGAENFSVEFDAKKYNRFIVHVLSVHQQEAKLAKVQIENE